MNRNTLLIVDDMEINRAILRALFENTYNLLEAENGEQALLLLNQYQDAIAAVLLDIVMPVKDGYQVMAEMEQGGLIKKIPVIVITAQGTSESEVRAFDLGASDIIMKPFEAHVVRRRVQNVIELYRHKQYLEEMVEEQAVKLRESQGVLMDALSSVIEHRSVESGQHILRIRMFTKVLLEEVMRSYPEYDLDERKIQIIASASALHDIGKIAIPDAVLNKPGPLTPEEFAVMKTHSEKGCEILEGLERMHDKEYLQYAYYICRYHHERWDGRGYPDGLLGEEIPVYAQVVGIADAYDALTSDRVYKKAYTPDKAYNMILNGDCGAFSPRLLECFKSVRQAFVSLTHAYADGASPKAEFEQIQDVSSRQSVSLANTLELGQMKYLALLRFLDCTVLEVDLASGVYHIIYSNNNDFNQLRSGNLFEESYLAFLDQSVHPEDRKDVSPPSYLAEFLTSGSMKRSQKYRVWNHASGQYVWYEVTALRISLMMQNLLLIWKCVDETSSFVSKAEPTFDSTIVDTFSIGVQQCLNDSGFTIVHSNQGLTTLSGYSREEIKTKFQNRYLEMIYPEDRPLVLQKFQDQICSGSSFELEYRLSTKDGRLLYILDKGQSVVAQNGVEYLNCILIDITQQKQAQEILRLTMERHQIIMDQTNDVIFEWDIKKNKIYYSSNWEKKYGYKPISEEISIRIPKASHILPDDMPAFIKLMNDVASGDPYGEAELRIANAEGEYRWCRLRATTQFDDCGKPIKAVGVILDIDEEKRWAQKLMEQAERDTLTKLFNKNAGRRRIQKHLQQNPALSAMLILDLDNFKTINDTLGHLFGDAVLVEVADQLKKLFPPEDIISRIGGDEFLIYLSNLSAKEQVAPRLEQLLAAIERVLAEELQDCRLSCSIGVACYPDDASGFQELFQRCDQALYQAKAMGKQQFCFYEQGSMGNAFGLKSQQPMAANTRIESDETYDPDTNSLIQKTFGLLYQASDIEAAIQSLLEQLGKKYNVSRAYIFEDSEDGAYARNTFEWCNEGIASQMEALQKVDYAELGGNYRENFNEYGIFYCTDLSTLPKEQQELLHSQKIHSLLQCAILNDGKFAGFVGFDDCDKRRMWTQNQISTLTFVSELLSVFLLKKRVQDRMLVTAQDLQMVLDNQNSWIYVIDPDTYALKYINAKTYSIVPQVHLGMHCYRAFFHRESPCTVCPVRDIREKVNQTMEVFNPVLKVWSLADASFIRWGGQEACLLCCHDITPYMEENEGGGLPFPGQEKSMRDEK